MGFSIPVLGGIGKLAGEVFKGIDSLHTSEEEKRELRLKTEQAFFQAQLQVMQFLTEHLKTAADLIKAEMNGAWYQRAWRPFMMFTFMSILANNYIIYPYFKDVGAKMLQFEPQFWEVLKIGLGGYLGLRTSEKIGGVIATFKTKKLENGKDK